MTALIDIYDPQVPTNAGFIAQYSPFPARNLINYPEVINEDYSRRRPRRIWAELRP